MKDIALRLLAVVIIIAAILMFGSKPSFSQVVNMADSSPICESCLVYAGKVFALIKRHYYEEVADELFDEFKSQYLVQGYSLLKSEQLIGEKLEYTAVRMMLRGVKNTEDRFTQFIPSQQSKTFRQVLGGINEDTGIEFKKISDGMQITEVNKRSSAAQMSLKKGEVIRAIDGEQIMGMSTEVVQDLLLSKQVEGVRLNVADLTGHERNVMIKNEEYVKEAVHSEVLQKSSGIGVDMVKNQANSFTINNVTSMSPAAEEGLEVDQEVLTVNGLRSEEISKQQITNMLNASNNQSVDLKIKTKRGEVKDVRLAAKDYYKKINTRDIVSDKPGVLIVNLDQFNEYSYADTLDQIDRVGLEKITHIIIDLRGNFGGEGMAVMEYLSLLFESDELLFWVDVARTPSEVRSIKGNRLYKGPVTVLVDSKTGSAAELFAMVLKSKGRARIIGHKTEGSSFLKQTYPLTDEALLYMTISKVYSHQKKSFGFEGLEPDRFIVEGESMLEVALSELEA